VLGRCLKAKTSVFAAFAVLIFASATCCAADLLSPAPIANQPAASPLPTGSIDAAAARRLNSIFVFGGTLTDGNMGQSVDAFHVPYESNHIVGGAYDRDVLTLPHGWVFSGQIGIADRFGDGSSGELWFGPRLRATIPVFDVLYISPALTAGLSAITNCIGIECQRAIDHHGNAHLLFYFSPEIAFTLQRYPDFDLVYQLHHRSGLDGTLGKMEEGTNANVVGVRYHF
jgi:hypothetical protein